MCRLNKCSKKILFCYLGDIVDELINKFFLLEIIRFYSTFFAKVLSFRTAPNFSKFS